jgi:hypothetical protein
MDEIRLPQHVVNRFEQQWKSRFKQTVDDYPEHAPFVPRMRTSSDRRKSRRLLEGSLKPRHGRKIRV